MDVGLSFSGVQRHGVGHCLFDFSPAVTHDDVLVLHTLIIVDLRHKSYQDALFHVLWLP